MAGCRGLFDLQHHVNAAAGRPSGRPADYQPAGLIDAIEDASHESQAVRHMMAATLLSSRIPLTAAAHAAIEARLLQPTPSACRYGDLADWHRQQTAAPMGTAQTASVPLPGREELHPAALTSWEIQTDVSFNRLCTTASAWRLTTDTLEAIAPRLDPQHWDESDFIDAAFGIPSHETCAVDHREEIHGISLGSTGYQDKRLHEGVSASFPGLVDGLSCDLDVSFVRDFGATVPNHALYELHCNHQGWLVRNEGHCYVRDTPDQTRLIFMTKHLCFNDQAPALLRLLAPSVLPIWLKMILLVTFP